MRTRKEIEKDVYHLTERCVQLAILEVLLDVRELLLKEEKRE